MRFHYLISGMILVALLVAAPALPSDPAASNAAVLYNFTGGPVDGGYPAAGVRIGARGVLYGTTFAGGSGIACGAAGCGTVYSLTPPPTFTGAWTEAVVHNFMGGGTDGATPAAALAIDSTTGVIYGTTYSGGAASAGTVFSLRPPTSSGGAWTEAILHNFLLNGSDAAFPTAGVVLDTNGVLYGTTAYGGKGGLGAVFSLTPPTQPGGRWTAAVLYSFGAAGKGSVPLAGVTLDGHRTLFGATSQGGDAGYGIAFGLRQSTTNGHWQLTVLHSFGGPTADGASPLANLVLDSTGVLYGATASGGTAGYGAVFSLAPPATGGSAWTETILYNFTGGPDGGQPRAGLLLCSTGVLYGTTYNGGSAGSGTVFSLTPPTVPGDPWTETVSYSFPGGSGGANPQTGLVMVPKGLVYGTTYAGGGSNQGTVFSVQP